MTQIYQYIYMKIYVWIYRETVTVQDKVGWAVSYVHSYSRYVQVDDASNLFATTISTWVREIK